MEGNFFESNATPRPHEHVSLKHEPSNLSSSAGSSGYVIGCFDCNICLETAQDPVVTLCGHLYCWPCMYKWLHVQATSDNDQNCPACKANISINSLVPLYGRGITPSELGRKKSDLDITIPRRPASSTMLNTNRHLQLRLPQSPLHHNGGYTTMASTGFGTGSSSSFFNPILGMFGEIVHTSIFGTYANLFPHPYQNVYPLVGGTSSGHRARRQEIQLEKSLNRVSVFLLCCIILCLLLF